MNYEIPKYPRLHSLRVDNDISQKTVAQYLHVKQNTYSRYETSTHNVPLEVMDKLADFYKTSVDFLMGRTNRRKPYPKPGEEEQA